MFSYQKCRIYWLLLSLYLFLLLPLGSFLHTAFSMQSAWQIKESFDSLLLSSSLFVLLYLFGYKRPAVKFLIVPFLMIAWLAFGLLFPSPRIACVSPLHAFLLIHLALMIAWGILSLSIKKEHVVIKKQVFALEEKSTKEELEQYLASLFLRWPGFRSYIQKRATLQKLWIERAFPSKDRAIELKARKKTFLIYTLSSCSFATLAILEAYLIKNSIPFSLTFSIVVLSLLIYGSLFYFYSYKKPGTKLLMSMIILSALSLIGFFFLILYCFVLSISTAGALHTFTSFPHPLTLFVVLSSLLFFYQTVLLSRLYIRNRCAKRKITLLQKQEDHFLLEDLKLALEARWPEFCSFIQKVYLNKRKKLQKQSYQE